VTGARVLQLTANLSLLLLQWQRRSAASNVAWASRPRTGFAFPLYATLAGAWTELHFSYTRRMYSTDSRCASRLSLDPSGYWIYQSARTSWVQAVFWGDTSNNAQRLIHSMAIVHGLLLSTNCVESWIYHGGRCWTHLPCRFRAGLPANWPWRITRPVYIANVFN